MSQHSLVCIVTRLKMTQERMEHKELVERRLREVLVEKEIMMWRKIIMVGQIRGWKEMKHSCGQVMGIYTLLPPSPLSQSWLLPTIFKPVLPAWQQGYLGLI